MATRLASRPQVNALAAVLPHACVRARWAVVHMGRPGCGFATPAPSRYQYLASTSPVPHQYLTSGGPHLQFGRGEPLAAPEVHGGWRPPAPYQYLTSTSPVPP